MGTTSSLMVPYFYGYDIFPYTAQTAFTFD